MSDLGSKQTCNTSVSGVKPEPIKAQDDRILEEGGEVFEA